MIGDLISHYAIRRKIGSGGMGEVYLAEDQTLHRPVALKILPAEFAADPQRKQRFLQEAHAASILTHPHISVIHEIGEAPSGVLYISMEYLEGMTLADRLRNGPLTLSETLDIAVQIADAIEGAHDKGITHRDLKPANIMITSRGHVKVLDFGLAKMVRGNRAVDEDESTGFLSVPGTVIGTVPYMSPEQALGHEVDHRTDIFSFGVVLYEMTTGRLPFGGRTAAERITNIARTDAEPPTRAGASIPVELERVILKCLQKDPARRYQKAGDVQGDLESIRASISGGLREQRTTLRDRVPRLLEKKLANALAQVHERGMVHRDLAPEKIYVTGSGDVTFADSDLRPAERVSDVAANVTALGAIIDEFERRPRYGTFAVVVAAAVVIAVAITWVIASRGRPPIPSPERQFTQLTFTDGVDTEPAIAPDGNSFAFVRNHDGKASIHVQRVGGTNTINLTKDSPADDTHPAFSPDGQQIAFRSEREGGGIFLMGATGENVRRLSDGCFDPAWSPDGKTIACSDEAIVDPSARAAQSGTLWLIDVATGGKKKLSVVDAVQPNWSPHGGRIAFWSVIKGARDLVTIGVDGKNPVTLLHDDALNWSPVWSPDGRYIYYASNRGGAMNLWRIGIDESTGRRTAPPEAITVSPSWSAFPSIARDGKTILFTVNRGDWSQLVAPIDPKTLRLVGPPRQILNDSRRYLAAEESPDGKMLTFTTVGQEDLFVSNVDGTNTRQLTNDAARDRGASWSPDGSRIAFYSSRGGDYDLWTIRPDGSDLQQITSGAHLINPVWSPDGKFLTGYSMPTRRAAIVQATPHGTIRWIMPNANGEALWPTAWSNDAQTLIGTLMRNGRPAGIGTYDLRLNRLEIISGRGLSPRLINGTTIMAFESNGRLLSMDLRTRQSRDLGVLAFLTPIPRITISPTHDRIYYASGPTQANIWMLKLQN